MKIKESGVKFIEEEHTYWYEGTRLYGITGVISKHLFNEEYTNIPEYVMERARAKGTRIHQECFTHDMFGTVQSEESGWYAELKRERGFNVIDSEYLVTDYKNFASAIDKLIIVDDKFILNDIKTTYKLNEEKLSWQLSILKYLFNIVNPDIKVDGLSATWIRNGASYHEIEEIPEKEVVRLLDCEVKGLKYEI